MPFADPATTSFQLTLKIQTSPKQNELCSCESLALAPIGNDQLLVGIGPFERASAPPRKGPAFYHNDFRLSDDKPWWIPAETFLRQTSHLSDAPDLKLADWREPDAEAFASVFRQVSESITRGEIEKSVPACAARAQITEGNPRSLISRLSRCQSPLMPYAFWHDGSGFVGASPELLFSVSEGQLSTMALAGTARANEAEIFAFDDKEIREHEFVAQTLVSKLSDIGMVSRHGREVMNLGSLIHFLSRIQVELYRDEALDVLIQRLHPTPALGPLPRTRQTLATLHHWRQKLNCPDAFGAPFGVLHEGRFTSLVAIRCVHWENDELIIPSGCGLIEASRLVNEWRELRLKRESVRQLFGL